MLHLMMRCRRYCCQLTRVRLLVDLSMDHRVFQFPPDGIAVHKMTTMLAHCNLKQNTWLCSKQFSFFPLMHCPLVVNRKTWWSIRILLGKMFIRLNTVHFFYQQKRNFLSSSVTCFGEISPFGQNPSSWQILYPAGHNFFDVKGPFLKIF